jgi:hypothetical protein
MRLSARRALVVLLLVAVVACSKVVLGGAATTTGIRSVATTTSFEQSSGSTVQESRATHRVTGGHLVKLDPETLEPLPGLDPIPVHMGSSIATSPDGTWLAIFDWGSVTPIRVSSWEALGPFEYPRHAARLLSAEGLFFYDDLTGEIRSLNLMTGLLVELGMARAEGLAGGLTMLDDGRLATLMLNPGPFPATYSVFVLDPTTGVTTEIDVGEIERIQTHTGVFAGEYEIPEAYTPGIVWSDERLYIAHADGLEVKVANLATGEVETHFIDVTTWLDRLLAYWVPIALAKGPYLGTSTSAALSPDGRFLLISGDRYETKESADGLIEETIPLGVTVVDTETWEVVEQKRLPFESIRTSGGVILGVKTRSQSPYEDVYALSVNGSGEISHVGPVPVHEMQCQPASASRMVCAESVGFESQRLSVVDLTTGDTTKGPEVGLTDHLVGSSVLMDWAPSLGK